jgi:hypothetical protein
MIKKALTHPIAYILCISAALAFLFWLKNSLDMQRDEQKTELRIQEEKSHWHDI